MPLLKRRGALKKAVQDLKNKINNSSSPFIKGYKYSQEEAKKGKQLYKKEIRFGGKSGFPDDARLSIVFQDIEPLSYYAHNMFSIGKAGFLTCNSPNECLLCNEGNIQKVFKSAWRVFLIHDNGDVEARYISRGNTELQHIAKIADAMKSRCSRCGEKMLMLGGKLKCRKHPQANGTELSDWVFEMYRTGEGTSTKWLFDRDRLVDEDLREKLDSVEGLELEKILAPKNDEYLKKVLADLRVDEEEVMPTPTEEATF